MITFEESGMTFGPFSEEKCFRIEKSPTYKRMEGVKIAEFILLHSSSEDREVVWIVEAKSSSPKVAETDLEIKSELTKLVDKINQKLAANKVTKTDLKEIKTDFTRFTDNINQKLANTLSLLVSICLQRHKLNSDELPDGFKCINPATVNFRLILVINGYKKDWCTQLKDALQKALQPTRKIWNLSGNFMTVLNDELAYKEGLITKND